MILTVLIASLTSAAPCALTGNIELTSEGKKVAPEGRVVVYVDKVPGTKFHAIDQPHVILQTGLQFKPEVLVVMAGESVQFTNEDKDEHSVFSKDAVPAFDLGRSRQGLTGSPVKFMFPGPARIQCNVHDWMRADILVVQNPFFALVGQDGTWRIEGLPVGNYSLSAWDRSGALKHVQVKSCPGEKRIPIPPLEVIKSGKPRAFEGGMRPVYQN